MQHIGDGVYASFDGNYIWLRVNSHENTPLVAIEPSVLGSLMKYAQDINDRYKVDYFQWPRFEPQEPKDGID